MRDIQAGRALRSLRIRRVWRQSDLGKAAGISQSMVSLAERGHFDRLALATIRTLFAALDASADLDIRWRGGALDVLLDEGHAALVAAISRHLVAAGWLVVPEVGYSVYGERGSIDLLAFHPTARVLLVVEVKTELTSVEATLRKLDEKTRLAVSVARERFGWTPREVGRLLVLAATSTQRRRVGRHRTVLDLAFPVRGSSVRRWMRRPEGEFAGLLFVSSSDGSGARNHFSGRKRVRPQPPRTNGATAAGGPAPRCG